jgi:transposase
MTTRQTPPNIQQTYENLKKQNPTKCLQLKHTKNNHYYIHQITSQYNKQTKKTTKQSTHLGTITTQGKYKPKKTTTKETKRDIYEYANAILAHNLLKDIETHLKQQNTPNHQDIIAYAIIQTLSQPPIRLLQTKWEKLYLSQTMQANLNEKHISTLLKDIGKNITHYYHLFSQLQTNNNLILYDLTTIFTYSKNLKLAEKGHNHEHQYQNQIGVIMAFDCKNHLPIGTDVFYGSMKDVSTITDFLKRLPDLKDRKIGFVFDRGFISFELLAQLRERQISYLVPLRKNSIDFDVLSLWWEDSFMYRDRAIRWAKSSCDYGFLYVFEDPLLRGEEEGALLRRVVKGELSMDEFELKREVAGVVAFVSDLVREPLEVYLLYKGREEVELAFDALKNSVGGDCVYLRDEESVRGYFFVCFLALRVYFKILQRLRERGLSSSVSVEEVLFELSKVERVVEAKTGREYYGSIHKRSREMLELFTKHIPMG